ncbi:unnamed protein product [Dimorphilus gyrociliatus]|uniref:Major facilitator superfamily (MFS) profile domain-containing protein n=1 Tax=Dimorphilus gyrociliatus TaxID=2664684 RepID=A0A7I8W7H2_9ANNE|nr:unnamed protein product [Dimorphilus gyrociliatus]
MALNFIYRIPNFRVPLLNKESHDVISSIDEKVHDPMSQRRLVLIIVCVALLLDNMLYMVIVPIIPIYLGEKQKDVQTSPSPLSTAALSLTLNWTSTLKPERIKPTDSPHREESSSGAIGLLFASKAIIQLLVNPFSGTVMDRVGYDLPLFVGLMIMCLSTTIFAFGSSYTVLFIARSMQGIGSAFADTAGMAMIADIYVEETERTKALGISQAFISFGSLFAPPFGGILYDFAGKCIPFIVLALVALIDGFLIFLVMKPNRRERKQMQSSLPNATPIYKLILDPYIAVCAGALVMANVSLAFIEPTIARWMADTMQAKGWEIGMVWLPAFFPHVLGVYLTVRLAKTYPNKQWILTAAGLTMEGISCLVLPFCTNFFAVIVPLSVCCFGIALIDTSVLPMLGFLVDNRHVSVYGSIYAIADISYSLAYAFGPIVAGGIVRTIGFTWLNVGIFFSNILYVPILLLLRNVYDYKQFENEGAVLVTATPGTGPDVDYKTYIVNDEKEVPNGTMNHLKLDTNAPPPSYGSVSNAPPPARPPPPTVGAESRNSLGDLVDLNDRTDLK